MFPVELNRDQADSLAATTLLDFGPAPSGSHGRRHGQCSAMASPMRHTDIPTTLNLYGDVVTDEMAEAGGNVGIWGENARLALHGLQVDCRAR